MDKQDRQLLNTLITELQHIRHILGNLADVQAYQAGLWRITDGADLNFPYARRFLKGYRLQNAQEKADRYHTR